VQGKRVGHTQTILSYVLLYISGLEIGFSDSEQSNNDIMVLNYSQILGSLNIIVQHILYDSNTRDIMVPICVTHIIRDTFRENIIYFSCIIAALIGCRSDMAQQ